MDRASRTVAKNASILMISQIITWSLAILLMVFLPRYLGVVAVGRFQLVNSLWAIAAMMIALGMDTFLTKEIARNPNSTGQLFGISVLLRAVMFVFGFGLVGLYAYLLSFPAETVQLIIIVGIATFFYQFSSACQAALQGLERMEYISLSDIASKAFITLVTIILLVMGYGVLAVGIVVVGGAIISFLIQFIALKRLQPLYFTFDWLRAKWMVKNSLPYLVNVGIRTVYVQIDIVIISWLVSEAVIGWYSAASRLFATLLFIPTVLVAAVFPAMSRIHTDSPDTLPGMMRKNFDLMLLFGVPIGMGLLIIANPLVLLLFGAEFAKSGPVLAIMGLVLILTYQNMLLGQFLISTDRQNTLTWVMAIATLATIPLDLFLIPLSQQLFNNAAIGAALSFVVTEAGIMIACMTLLPKGTLRRSNLWVAARILFAGLVMVATTWWLRQTMMAIPIVIGAISYIVMILVLRVISKDDWVLIKSLIQIGFVKLRKVTSSPTRAGG
jgi:O-antigen/teichoic acid export membrane protein